MRVLWSAHRSIGELRAVSSRANAEHAVRVRIVLYGDKQLAVQRGRDSVALEDKLHFAPPVPVALDAAVRQRARRFLVRQPDSSENEIPQLIRYASRIPVTTAI